MLGSSCCEITLGSRADGIFKWKEFQAALIALTTLMPHIQCQRMAVSYIQRQGGAILPLSSQKGGTYHVLTRGNFMRSRQCTPPGSQNVKPEISPEISQQVEPSSEHLLSLHWKVQSSSIIHICPIQTQIIQGSLLPSSLFSREHTAQMLWPTHETVTFPLL